MTEIGIRELKNQATEILREVREQQAEYIVTYRGRAVAVLLPLNYTERDDTKAEADPLPAAKAKSTETVLAELEVLRQKIGQAWKSNLTAVEAVAEQRR